MPDDNNTNSSLPGWGTPGEDNESPSTPPTPSDVPTPPVESEVPATNAEEPAAPLDPIGSLSPSASASYPTVPDYTSAAGQEVKTKSTAKIIIIGVSSFVGIISLCIIAAFAYKSFSGNTAGSAKPEGVITNALSSLKAHDLVGVLQQADPNEVEPFIENLDTFKKELKKDDQVRNDKKPLEAYSYKVEDLKTQTVNYSDSVARVELISGKITQTIDKSKLPSSARDGKKTKEVYDISDVNKSWLKGSESYFFFDSEKFNPAKLESKHIFYIAVKRGDRWYASTLYTGAEYIRILGNAYGGDYERPSFDASKRVGIGSDTPEKATENFIKQFVGLDTEQIIKTTAPDRFSVAYDYKDLLIKADDRNAQNSYWKTAHNAVTVTDLKTTKKEEGTNRDFVAVKFINVKVNYSLDVKEEDKQNYAYVPYSAHINASWNGKCAAYSGNYQTYDETGHYFSTVTFPITDAEGTSYVASDFDSSYPDAYNLTFPVKDAAGHIYPTDYSLTDYTTYHPVPWKNVSGDVVYDAAGNLPDTTSTDSTDDNFTTYDDYPYTDANGAEVIDKDGRDVDADLAYTYESHRTNLDDKSCFSNADLKNMPDYGVVTIKEGDKYYVSPIDTFWHYVIWGVNHN